MSNKRQLTTASIPYALSSLAFPMLFGIMSIFSVSMADTYFVSKLGKDALAAISFTFPVTLTVLSLSIGLSAGAASMVSRTLGRGDRDEAKVIATDAMLLALAFVLFLSVLGYVLSEFLFDALGAKGHILKMSVAYMEVWFLSMPFLTVPMVASGIIRASGDGFWPSLIMILASLLNIVFTPMFIFGWGIVPDMHIEGAAWGTFVARGFSLLFALYLLLFRKKLLALSVRSYRHVKSAWLTIAKIGVPAAFGNATNPMGITAVTAIIASLSHESVAAFGVATRLEAFAVIPMLALSSAIGPVSGQNWGAQQYGRVRSALTLSFSVCFVWAMFVSFIFFVFGDPLVSIFSSDQKISKEAQRYLYIVPLSVWGYGVVIIASGAFNALGHSLTGLMFYLIRTVVFYVPLSWFASLYFKIDGVFYAIALSNVFAGLGVASLSLHYLKKLTKDVPASSTTHLQ